MRHIYAYRVTYLIAALIVAVAMLFAWLRSHDVPPGQEEAMDRHCPVGVPALAVTPDRIVDLVATVIHTLDDAAAPVDPHELVRPARTSRDAI